MIPRFSRLGYRLLPLLYAWPTAVGAERTSRVPSRHATRHPSPTQATPFWCEKGKPKKYHGIENYIFVGGDFDIFMTWVVHFDTCSTLDFHNLHLAKCSPTFHPRHAAWWHPTLHLQHLKKKLVPPSSIKKVIQTSVRCFFWLWSGDPDAS